MPVNIQVLENEAEEIVGIYIKKQHAVQAQINKLVDELNRIQITISHLKHAIQQNSPKQDNLFYKGTPTNGFEKNNNGSQYNKKTTWFEKIKYMLNENSNTGLTTKQIIKRFDELEPDYVNKHVIMKSITGVLSNSSKPGGLLVKEKNNEKAFVYRLNDNSMK